MSDPFTHLQRLNKFYQTSDALHLKDLEKTAAVEDYVKRVSGLFIFPVGFNIWQLYLHKIPERNGQFLRI